MIKSMVIFGQFNIPTIAHYNFISPLTRKYDVTIFIPAFYKRNGRQDLTRSIPLKFEEVAEIVRIIPGIKIVKWSFYEPYVKYLPLFIWKIHETKKLMPEGSKAFTRDYDEGRKLWISGIETLYGERTGISSNEVREMIYNQDPRWREYVFPFAERVIERPQVWKRLMKFSKMLDETIRIGNLKVPRTGFTYSRKLTDLIVRLYYLSSGRYEENPP